MMRSVGVAHARDWHCGASESSASSVNLQTDRSIPIRLERRKPPTGHAQTIECSSPTIRKCRPVSGL